jgi:hypothetical protein
MYELLIGRHLFNTEAKTHWTEEDDHLAQILEITDTASFPADLRVERRHRSGARSSRIKVDFWLKKIKL